jgi:glycosyltransferase involved in cell wall biosynthesis
MENIQENYILSVIIPTFNRSLLLSYTLESLVGQQLVKTIFEVIVCDDGSSDDTQAVVKRYADLLNLKYLFQEDLGYRPGSARNSGIRAAEGRICVFIDCGVILQSECLSEHIKFYADNNNLKSAVGYVYGFDHDDKSERELKKLIDIWNIDLSIENLKRFPKFADIRDPHYIKYNDSIEDLPASWFYFWTCHVSSLRAELIKTGLFDSYYDGKWGVEDLDLGLRLSGNGRKIYLLKSAKSVHYPHGKNKKERRTEGYENLKYFHQKFNTIGTRIFFERYLTGTGNLRDLNQAIKDHVEASE